MKAIFTFVSLLALSFAADDTYELCAEEETITGLILSIYRDTDNEMAKLMINGPNSAWFAYGIGNNKMNGMQYALHYKLSESAQKPITKFKSVYLNIIFITILV